MIKQEMLAAVKEALESKICPFMQKPCIRNLCWQYLERGLVWKEEEMTRAGDDPKRVVLEETGKIIDGTEVRCNSKIFQPMIVEAKYAEDGKFKISKDGIITYSDGRPVNSTIEEEDL
jgi:hypothetical protein